MKNYKNTLIKEHEKVLKLQKKMLIEKKKLTEKEVEFLKKAAENGQPLNELTYGLYLFIYYKDIKAAEEWWTKFFEHAGSFTLYKAHIIFILIGEEYGGEWAAKCLLFSACPLAIEKMNEIKEYYENLPKA